MSDSNDFVNKKSDNLLSDMVLSGGETAKEKGSLVVEPDEREDTDEFSLQIEQTLRETENQVKKVAGEISDQVELESWNIARKLIEDFKPVPYFIWRISNFVLGKPGNINNVSEGLLYGMRRLLFAIASDEVLGKGEKVDNVKDALKILEPDVIAASSIVYAICRRLSSQQFERIWRPILDDALLRTRIGYMIGKHDPDFGAGRGMLAGFSGRVGLTILIASGELDQARRALEMLATGESIKKVGLSIYLCDPLQVSAFTLSASGCGRDAALGTASYGASATPEKMVDNPEQLKWIASFALCENIRMSKFDQISDDLWSVLGITTEEQKSGIANEMKQMVRRGHGWNWFVS